MSIQRRHAQRVTFGKPSKTDPLWMRRRPGERYPYPAGRTCILCDEPLSRYTPGPTCCRHEEHVQQEEAVA